MDTTQILWATFAHDFKLSDIQLAQYQQYYTLLIQANELFNITAITDVEKVIPYHFADSLKVTKFVDFTKLRSIADVGTGGGFPGIPLKIKFPELQVTLIEVSQKKRDFLQQVITALNLQRIGLCDLDWRTFLRKTDTTIDLFCARASLQPDELIRVFAPSSPYKGSTLVYWAAQDWQPSVKESTYLKACYPYLVGDRKRKYCVFSAL